MSDNLEWMNKHAVLLREPQWAGIAAKENYKIRPDLMPLFNAHPDSQELLEAFAEKKLYREGCEFIARMIHRRAAVWWGYCCLLDLFDEREEVRTGAVKPKDVVAKMRDYLVKLTGMKLPPMEKKLTPENIDDFCKMPEIDYRKLLEFPKPPPQDRSALDAAAAATGAKLDKLATFIPPKVSAAFQRRFDVAEGMTSSKFGMTAQAMFAKAKDRAEAGPLTYTVDRFSDPRRQKVLELPQQLEEMRKENLETIKAAHPEKFPATPEALKLIRADEKKRTDEAVQAVWRWIVSPDERNTTLAMAAGNGRPGTPEGMLAYVAAWSFGDLAPEGKMTVPVPPELPGTGLNSALLMMAVDKDGYRKMPERFERYFKMGVDVVFGKNLWPESVSEKLSPHAQLAAKWAEKEA